MKKNKKILKYFSLGILGLFLIVLSFIDFKKVDKINLKKAMYVANDNEIVKLYNQDFEEVKEIPRGIKVTTTSSIVNEETEIEYLKINYDNQSFLIEKTKLVSKLEEVVLEKELYVRTPVTVYANAKTSKIKSVLKKGEKVEIIGFDNLDIVGKVNKYKIKVDDEEGYIYGKYLVRTEEMALMNYDQDNNYQKHLKRVDTQGGGKAGNLDYFPYEKPQFENNVMPTEVRALYLNSGVVRNVDEYIKLAKETNINAFVVDIKDDSAPGYASLVMKKYSPTNYKYANNSFERYQEAIKKIKEANFYVIGRITVFKDAYFVKDNPGSAIVDKGTQEPFRHNGSYWPSAFDRLVWEFNVELAKEAIEEMGFNEIQFDYIRFPDRTNKLEREGKIDMKNLYQEEKAQAIQGFLFYATDEIHQLDAYVAVDVFGESAHPYVTGYGQYWAALSNIADVISAMPYPDHFNAHEYGFKEIVWTVPYQLLKFWGENYVGLRQQEIPTPAIVRTWIQAYNTIREPYIEYNAERISEQIRGLYDAGLRGGYMTWNAGSSLSKYKMISEAFNKVY